MHRRQIAASLLLLPAGRALAKSPAESRPEWDLCKLVQTIPASDAFRPLAAGLCPLVDPPGKPSRG